jgi:phosphatidylinositol alpha-mannosyltransferase
VRIGIVCPYPWDVPGGVLAHVRDLAETLIASGHDVVVLAPVESSKTALPSYVTDAGRPVRIPYNGSVARLLLGPVSWSRTRRWVRQREMDVLHVHEPTAPSVSLLAAYAADGPMVATFHTSNARSRLLTAAEPLLTPALEKVVGRIAVSPAARRTVVEHLGGDCVEIPNGVDVARFASATALPEPSTGPVVAFIGRVDEPRKGLAVLLEAWPAVLAAVADAELLVAGPGVAGRLPPGVRTLGQVDEPTKAALLARAAADGVFCAPNLGGESFGIILLEAMAAGAPVVASDLEAFRRVLDDGAAGVLVPPEDPERLARELVSLLTDAPGRQRLATVGRAVADRYDWGIVAARVVEVYEAAVSAGPPGRVRLDRRVGARLGVRLQRSGRLG